MDQLNSLPYLDNVIRETLRVHAPVPATTREATVDDVIPVEEPFVDRYGQVQDSIKSVISSLPGCAPSLCFLRCIELIALSSPWQNLEGHSYLHPHPVDQPLKEALGRGRVRVQAGAVG